MSCRRLSRRWPRRRSLLLVALLACAPGDSRGDDPSLVRLHNASAAMERTLPAGAEVAVARIPPDGAGASIARGEIVMFRFPPDSSDRSVMRVVGVPGDTIAMLDGRLQRNGLRVDEPYAWHDGAVPVHDAARRSRRDWGPIVVPPGQYFVLGDNRDHALDSRYWGFVPRRMVLGRVVRTDGVR